MDDAADHPSAGSLSVRTLLPLVLVIGALVGSVVIPASQTWQILDLLRETTEGVDPAKVLTVRQLERSSLLWNTLLVAAAFTALSAVIVMTARERRLLEEAREARRRLERVIASRSRLIRGFSHDVKNPVGAADGYAALLTEGIYGALNPRQLESVHRIRHSLQSALALIDDLHELGRAETGHLSISHDRVDVNALLTILIDEYEAAARAGGLTLTSRLHPHLSPIWTSQVRVQQIVSNLLSNAIKYAPRGAITVETRLADADPTGVRGEWLQVHVADTGPGIPRDKQEFIFEEFSRIGAHGTAGAGLGLAISRLIAGALGGRLTLESEVGRGSRFTLWLPMTDMTKSPGADRVGRAANLLQRI